MKYIATLTITATLIVLGLLTGETRGMPSAQCNPNVLSAQAPKIRKICNALNTLYELGIAMENYIDEKVLQDNLPWPEGVVKRQDVDHVFLRFGRRR